MAYLHILDAVLGLHASDHLDQSKIFHGLTFDIQIRLTLTSVAQDTKTLAVIQQDGVAQESRVLPLKRKIESGDSTSPRKQRILESYSTGDICRVVATVHSDF
jgi:hypothetical protein